ncbi:hypothetical protein E4T56_gene16347 [Termitomyces sp. T112]|nr:hypothetical protein E4T56_gene16347 [Termitomyces sp. T112]KNZ79864.1 hypothetical protein J132_08522 [Termitomyces sp. J132]
MSKSPAPKPGKLTLYSNHLSPNGLKVSIYLEELRAKEPALFESVTLERVDLSTGMHKQPSFLKLNPNGRIPILVDHNADDFPVFESAAILLYLEQNYDKKKAFSFDAEKSPKEYSSILQWIFFAHGGLGPMQGQAHYFLHYCAEDVPFAKNRYREEVKRLYGVLEKGLANRDWLVGPGRGRYTIADMNAFPWVRLHTRAGVEDLGEWPNLKAWLVRISEQPGVKAAIKWVALK